MRQGIVATVALFVLVAGAPAIAADMPLKAPVNAPPPVVDLWSGLYAGGNVGYSWGEWHNSSVNGNFPGGGGFVTIADPDLKGWVAGAQFGVNKLYGQWLLGLEADIQATGEDADLNGTTTAAIGNATLSLTQLNHWKLPWFATLRGRVGVTVADTWLLYATGGLAVGHADYSHTSTATITAAAGTATASILNEEGNTKAGFAVGAGVEKALDAHWRVKAEYLYIDFGSHTFLGGTGFDDVIRVHDNIARAGFNYRFLP